MRYSRRRFLTASGTAAVLAMAGCATDGDGEDEMTTDDGMGDDGMTTDDGMGDDGMTTDDGMGTGEPMNPADAERVTVDRFSEAAGTLMVRSEANDLPGPGEPVDFDQAPFLTKGLGPDGGHVSYYNFDVQPTTPAPIYVLFREGEDSPVADQLNVVDAVPGDDGYNDFWQVTKVTVPEDYRANTGTSLADLQDAGYPMEPTPTLVNCPVVPAGSTATMRAGDSQTGLVDGWYRGQVVSYFQFTEGPLQVSGGSVPLSPIYVAFNANPGTEGGGPASGFATEMDSDRTHNVVATLPGDDGYSPLWLVTVYDNADFEAVSDLDAANSATILDSGVATVNCPIVAMQ